MSANDEKAIRLWADFNGLFGEILCLSHRDTAPDENGNEVPLRAGMFVTAFMEDLDDKEAVMISSPPVWSNLRHPSFVVGVPDGSCGSMEAA